MLQHPLRDSTGSGDRSEPPRPLPDAAEGPKRRLLDRLVIHPFLLALFPILALFARNSVQVPYGDLALPVATALAVAGVVWLLAAAILRDWARAGIFASLAVIPFYNADRFPQSLNWWLRYLTYQYLVLRDFDIAPWLAYLMAAAVLSILGLALLAFLRPVNGLTRPLNLFAIFLVLWPLAQAVHAKGIFPARQIAKSRQAPVRATAASKPDIYYIILDGYARSDVMRELFDFDNSAFLDRLEAKGFYIAREANANYCQTSLSLASSLNFEYLDAIVKDLGTDQTELRDRILHSNLVETLRPLGYRFTTFSTGFTPTELSDADIHHSPYPQFTEFQRMLIDRTPVWAMLALAEHRDLFTQARDRTLHLLDRLPSLAKTPHPTLAFAHLVCPHPPFLFGPNGEDVSRRDEKHYLSDGTRFHGMASDPQVYIRGYRDQAIYITRRIEEAIDQILANSTEPPIILLQSDHGSGLRLNMESVEGTDLRERMGILSAYYFPDRNDKLLHPGISPVNSFRVVLNTYFGADLDLLPDRSYFSTWPNPHQFIDVTEEVHSDHNRDQ